MSSNPILNETKQKQEVTMTDLYKAMYCGLFNAITDALNALEQEDPKTAREVLIHAQQQAEELYIEAEDIM
jgi:hypothetical protein